MYNLEIEGRTKRSKDW